MSHNEWLGLVRLTVPPLPLRGGNGVDRSWQRHARDAHLREAMSHPLTANLRSVAIDSPCRPLHFERAGQGLQDDDPSYSHEVSTCTPRGPIDQPRACQGLLDLGGRCVHLVWGSTA